MTESERALDRASKLSALAVLGMSAATAAALFPGAVFGLSIAAIPMILLGALQRFTERPWLAGAAAVWGAAAAVIWQSPTVGVGAAVAAGFFVRHWLLVRKLGSKPEP